VSGFGTRLKVKEGISVEAMRTITLVFIAFLVLATPAVSFSGTYALSRGIAEYSFNPVYTTQVFGWMNLSVVKVYGDYFRNGTFLDSNSFSVQLNVYTTDGLWVQDVLLISVVGNEVNVTPVINVWNVSGSTLPLENYTSYDGLAVYVGLGKPFLTSLPLRVFLNVSSGSEGIRLSYWVNGISNFTFLPLRDSTFQIGGLVNGLPADAELVIGGSGGGSVAYLYLEGNSSLFYLSHNGTAVAAPIAISRGLSTGEGAFGFNVTSPLGLEGVALLGNFSDNYLLWPHPSSLSLKRVGSDLWVARLCADGEPLKGQEIEVYSPSLQVSMNGNGSQISLVKPIFVGYTNSSGEISFRYNGSVVLAYYPGNSSVLPSFAVSAKGSSLSNYFSNVTNELLSKLKSLKWANLSFPSQSSHKVYPTGQLNSQGAVNVYMIYPVVGYSLVALLTLLVAIVLRGRGR